MRTVDFIPSHCPQKKARTTPGVVLAMCVAYESRQLFLAVYFVRNRELLTAFGTTRSQNATTVGSRHALTETMLVVSLAIVGLERSFHFLYRYYCCSVQCSRIRHSDSKISKKISLSQTFVLLSAQ